MKLPTAIARFLILLACVGLACVGFTQAVGFAQDQELTIPEPESVTLKTKDFVQLQCTFYPGGFKRVGDKVEQIEGKEVVPVMLLHGWGQKRQDLSSFGRGLQSLGHAVIVPDLRGHGRSTKLVGPTGNEIELDHEKFRREHIASMLEDLSTCKRYLLKLNNEGKLNIELLTVVAGDAGGLVAMNWIAYDWSRPQLPTIKQGRDVKAFVLLSPPMAFKGATIQPALRSPAIARELDGLIIVGQRDTKGRPDAKRIYDQLKRQRQSDERDLFMMEPDTSLNGISLIPARGLNVASTIAKFINLRIVQKSTDFPWRDRTNPLSQ